LFVLVSFNLQETLSCVMRVIELGISGKFSTVILVFIVGLLPAIFVWCALFRIQMEL